MLFLSWSLWWSVELCWCPVDKVAIIVFILFQHVKQFLLTCPGKNNNKPCILKWLSKYHRKLSKNPTNFEIERTPFWTLKLSSESFKWLLMDQIIWNFRNSVHVKHLLHTTDTILDMCGHTDTKILDKQTQKSLTNVDKQTQKSLTYMWTNRQQNHWHM